MFQRLLFGTFGLIVAWNIQAFAQSNMQKADEFRAKYDYVSAVPYIVAAAKESPNNMSILLKAGDTYLQIDKPDSALMYFEKAEKLDAKNTEMLRYEARALAELGRRAEALKTINRAIEIDKNDVKNYLVQGQVYIAADSLQKADYIIRKAQALNDKIPDTYVALGDLYFAQRVYELAQANYEEALKRDEKLFEPRVKLARTYTRLANSAPAGSEADQLFSKALQMWDYITKIDTNNASAFLEKGKISFQARKYADAARSLYRYTQLQPDNALIRWYLGQSLYEVHQYDSAVSHLEYAKAHIDSVRDKATELIARSYFEAKNYKQAAAQYTVMKAMGKLQSEDKERLGYAQILSGDTTSAIATFTEVVNSDSTKCTLAFRLGNLLRQRKDYQQAVDIFSKRAKNCKDSLSSTVYYLIGVSYYSMSNVDSAMTAFIESIRADSTNISAHTQLGKAYNDKKEMQKSKEEFQKAIDIGKTNPAKYQAQVEQVYGILCSIALEAKNYAEVKRLSTEWLAVNNDAVFAHLYKAIAHQGLEEKEDACKHYREVLKRDPANKTAKQNMASLDCGK